jgi:hypothetical protein
MVFITILYDLGLEMSYETRVKVSWSTPFTSGHLGFELPTIGAVVEMGILSTLIETTAYGVYHTPCILHSFVDVRIEKEMICPIVEWSPFSAKTHVLTDCTC